MQFILDQQAAVSAWQARTERSLHGLRVLVQTGMKMLTWLEKQTKELQREMQQREARLDARLNALIDAQLRTDAKLDRLIDHLGGRRTNGHPKSR